jgi:DNA-nicking Smr family endonuclease
MPEGKPPKDRERSEFQQAMSDATPLDDRDKLHPAPKTLRRRRARVSAEGESVEFEVDRLGERVEGIAAGIDHAILRKLRNGEIPRDARIDLHGLAAAAARTLVRETLLRAHAESSRCVLVIHGRGRRSEDEPVLKEALLEWLAEPPLGQLVMAFTSATGGDGGVGATYVLLRRDLLRHGMLAP